MQAIIYLISSLLWLSYAGAATAPAAPTVLSVSKPVMVTSNDNPSPGNYYIRDGGFFGYIGSRTFTMNFDTCPYNAQAKSCPDNSVASNSFTDLTSNPAVVHDPIYPDGHIGVENLCNKPNNNTWITNTIGLNDTHGVCYFVTIGPPGEQGYTSAPCVIDATNTVPTCTRVADAFWYNTTSPLYGGNGALAVFDGYIYLYGTLKLSLYVARVKVGSYMSKAAYQYWNGSAYTSSISAARPIINDTYGGSVSFSNHFHGFLYLSTQFAYAYIGAQVSASPAGPWSPVTIINTTEQAYQPNALPTYDNSGKTLAMRFSVPFGNPSYYQKYVNVTFA